MEKFNEALKNRMLEGFETFDMNIATLITGGFLKAISGYLQKGIDAGDENVVLELPHGTYTAAVKEGSEHANINVAFEFSKAFTDYLKEKSDKFAKMDVIDKKFMEIFAGCAKNRKYDPKKDEFEDIKDEEFGVDLTTEELNFFTNEIAEQIVILAKENMQAGKVYAIELDNHGTFEFELNDDDKPVCRFIADKVFKQDLKRA